MDKITILLFATLKELAGAARIELQIEPGASVADLKAAVGRQYPKLSRSIGTSIVSINFDFASDDEVVPKNAEIALFPPVSGGSDRPTVIEITTDPLDMDSLSRRIVLPDTGAVCAFTGYVRGITKQDKSYETLYLEYEAYQPMAERKMQEIAEEMRSRWPDVVGILLVQRVGRVDAGIPTVMVACSAGHRDQGVFEAARYGIDRLKEIVPIWKKEVSPSGEQWVEGTYHPDQKDQQNFD